MADAAGTCAARVFGPRRTRCVVMGIILERVSKMGSASNQVLTREAGCLLSSCHQEAAEAVDGRAVEVD